VNLLKVVPRERYGAIFAAIAAGEWPEGKHCEHPVLRVCDAAGIAATTRLLREIGADGLAFLGPKGGVEFWPLAKLAELPERLKQMSNRYRWPYAYETPEGWALNRAEAIKHIAVKQGIPVSDAENLLAEIEELAVLDGHTVDIAEPFSRYPCLRVGPMAAMEAVVA
jgi:hypothetical protein